MLALFSILTIVGGPDAGNVAWHPSVVEAARGTGLEVDEEGNVKPPAGAGRDFAGLLDVTATIVAASSGFNTMEPLPPEYQGFDLVAPIAAGRPSPRKAIAAALYDSFAVVTPGWTSSGIASRISAARRPALRIPSKPSGPWSLIVPSR